MFGWRAVVAVAATAAILFTLIITLILHRCYNSSKRATKVTQSITAPPPQTRPKTHLRPPSPAPISKIETRPRLNLPNPLRGSSTKPTFEWPDHPSLISGAGENGWSRFAFTSMAPSQSTRSTRTLLGCVGDLHHNNQQLSCMMETHVEITWEARERSLDFMQKIRFNPGPGLKKLRSVVRTALPLPGPPLRGCSSFPEDAYFEVTILCGSSSCGEEERIRVEGEKVKLIQKGLEGKRGSDSIGSLTTTMCVGMSSSRNVPIRVPGSYRGSIGFNSDGSVYVDGIKLVFGSGKESWGQHKVIGCGFNPTQKRVFFTVDSELAHMVNCKSEDFGSPLYPVISANADITILVNMGQTSFSYEPANAARTSDPCFTGSILSSPTTKSYDDSEELFSMGRIDSGWLNHSATKSSTNSDVYSWCSGAYNNNTDGMCRSKLIQDDDVSEADLFEIALDVNGKSQKV